LHRNALGFGAFAQRVLFALGQPQGHRHGSMVSVRYQ
jgi:hypothetical protein